MNRSIGIFNLGKSWGMKITLIIAALVLAGCQSQTVPSTATAISTRTEISATATLVPTNTPEPTATATELVVPDNAVEIVGGGYAYVENGKLMLLGADGLAKEVKDPSYDVVFNTMDDAKSILKELNPEAINVTREDFFPGGYPTEPVYKFAVDSSGWRTLSDESQTNVIGIAGIARAFVRVKNPVDFPIYPDIGVTLFAVNGYDDLLPMPTVAFNAGGESFNLVVSVVGSTPQQFSRGANRSFTSNTLLSELSWAETQNLLRSGIMYFSTPYSVLPENLATPLVGYDYQHIIPYLDPNSLELVELLIDFQALHVGATGYEYQNSLEGNSSKTGELLKAVAKSEGNFFINPLPTPMDLILTSPNN